MTIDVTGIRTTSVYAEEALVVDLQSLLHTVMVEKGMTRAQLARAMDISKARVTQLFSDDCSNFTVRLLARALHALGERLEVTCPAYEKVRRRLQMIESLEEVRYAVASNAVRWEMPANDFGRDEIAKVGDGQSRTSSLIARSLQRTTDHRRAA